MEKEELQRMLRQVQLLDRLKSERMRMILDSMTETFFALDAEWRFTDLNTHAQAQLERLGRDPGKLIGKVLWDEFPTPAAEDFLRRAMRERVAITCELYSSVLSEWTENRIYPSPDGGLAIFQSYITERKRSEQERRRRETYFDDAQRLSHTGSWAFNICTEEMFWSAEQFRLLGLDPGHIRPSYELAIEMIHPDDRSSVQQVFAKAVAERGDYALDFRLIRPDGEVRHVRSLAHPVFNDAGELLEYVGTAIDMTDRVREIEERKRAETALQHARSELAHVTRTTIVGELAGSLAHELNQPLAAIAMNAGACMRWLARDEPAIEQARHAAERIASDAIRAGQVIAQTKAMLKKSEGVRGNLDTTAIVHEVLILVHPEIQRQGIVVHSSLAEGLPAVWGSRVLLQQVVLNLILNAIESMTTIPDGSHEMRIRSQWHETDREQGVLVAVEDAGIGFASGDADRLFDAFYTTKSRGLGMGLSISRTIIEDHGGRLWGASKQPHGSTFQFVLPVSPSGGE
jgi:PAS domain S-box-containing protein